MAHNIEFRKDLGKHSFVSVKEIPWHGLGTILEEKMTAAQAMEHANLNYTVAVKPAYIRVGDRQLKIPKKFGIYRTDLNIPFNVVGGAYTPIQNADAFTFFDEFVDRGEAMYETAGCLGQGERVFITAKLPESVCLTQQDKIDQYLLFTLCHDGTAQVEVLFTPVRVVCNNTLQMALNRGAQSARVTIRHTSNADERLKEAATVLGISAKFKKETFEKYLKMAETRVSDDAAKKVITSLFLKEKELEAGLISAKKLNVLNDVFNYYKTGAGQQLDTADGTVWGLYNGITGYFQNCKDYATRKTSVAPENKFKYMFFSNGYANRIMQGAYELASDLIA